MKKIMFNDRYGLTEAVLEGRKTMTRRTIPLTDADREYLDTAFDFDLREWVIIDRYARYKVGEEVAVAQRYQDIPMDVLMQRRTDGKTDRWPFESLLRQSHGWSNKQGVVASLMPHRIRITAIKVERLQDISDEDCLREGIIISKGNLKGERPFGEFTFNGWDDYAFNARDAFAALIDRISGKDTWKKNPWVFAYEFELTE